MSDGAEDSCECGAGMMRPEPWDDFEPHCSLQALVPWAHDRLIELQGMAASKKPTHHEAEACDCGHPRSAHIYHEGACRPGFVCEEGCEVFTVDGVLA